MINLSSSTVVTFAVLNHLSWLERLHNRNLIMTAMQEGSYEDAWHHL